MKDRSNYFILFSLPFIIATNAVPTVSIRNRWSRDIVSCRDHSSLSRSSQMTFFAKTEDHFEHQTLLTKSGSKSCASFFCASFFFIRIIKFSKKNKRIFLFHICDSFSNRRENVFNQRKNQVFSKRLFQSLQTFFSFQTFHWIFLKWRIRITELK